MSLPKHETPLPDGDGVYEAVSYTHLDVYKRQTSGSSEESGDARICC